MVYNHGQDKPFRILMTGGHGATAGIAVIEKIKEQLPEAEIFWIGTNRVISGSNATSLEYKIYPNMGVKYYSINAGKLQTKFTRYTIPQLFLIPVGFFQAFILLLKIKPKVILSFGGFSSFPVVVLGWCFGIPVILHEQTVAAGRASIASAFFAKKIALSRQESLKYFPENKCIVTGNPLMSRILAVKPKAKIGKEKLLLVVGGSRGSEFINEEMFKIRENLTANYKVVHVVGERDFNKYNSLNTSRYTVLSFVNPDKMADLYEQADVIVSRAGANTVSEIISVKRPAILIPLPRTYLNEQVKNAEYAVRFGVAKMLTEDETNSQSLLREIKNAFDNWQETVSRIVSKPTQDDLASQRIVELVKAYI